MRSHLLCVGAVISASSFMVVQWAIRLVSEAQELQHSELLDQFVKERERRFVRAMNMGTAMDEDDENP